MTINARDTLRERLPKWLRIGTALRIAYALGLHADVVVEGMVEGIKTWFPGFNGYSSIALQGRDRRIRRGLIETDASYAERLLRWLDDHPRRGGPYAMLEQLHAFFPAPFRIELINTSGRRYTKAIGGAITRDDVSWTPPGDHPDQWARWWLFFFVPDPPDNEGLWGDPGIWGDGGLWGVELTAEELDTYQVVASEWRAAHVEGRIVILDESEQWDTYAPGAWPVQIGVR